MTLLLAIAFLAAMCVEPFEVDTNDFEEALVVDATITDEMGKQQILLNRAFLLEEFNPLPEENAIVKVVDDDRNEYEFAEIEPGKYVSVQDFAAEYNRGYQLLIRLQNGNSYTSKMENLPQAEPIQDLAVSRTSDDKGEEGISIAVNFDAALGAQYYRYEYEEAYKIVAPKWKGERLIFSGSGPPVVFPLENEEQVCYAEDVSKGIIIGSSLGPTGNSLPNFEVRFIDRNNFIISHRYSILIKQFTLSKEAYDYFELLERFSGQSSILSQTQPGFFNGNIHSDMNDQDKVLGYFDLSAVSSKRIFFNYVDFFADEPLPPYPETDCEPYVASSSTSPTLTFLLSNNLVRYFSMDPLTQDIFVVPRICADCNVLGSPKAPEFWEE